MDDLQLRRLAHLGLKLFARARDRKHFVIEKLLDAKRDLYIAPSIAALSGSILLRRKHWEFRFPISEHMGLHADDLTNLADLKVNLFRYHDRSLSHNGTHCVKVLCK